MKYLVVDVEATNGATNETIEIIEVGYTIVEGAEITIASGEFVRPCFGTLDPFITQLTTITHEDLKEAETFPTVIRKLFAEFPPEEYCFVAWGDFDYKMFRKMYELWSMPEREFAKRINLKKEHKAFYNLTSERGLSRASNHAGIPFMGCHHRGEDDAFQTAKIMLNMMSKGWDPERS